MPMSISTNRSKDHNILQNFPQIYLDQTGMVIRMQQTIRTCKVARNKCTRSVSERKNDMEKHFPSATNMKD
jgi:Fic family protein